ncbi:MATE family efflux transporter [Roseimarinus sediminis]|uniref:MATE family efflux transporter n=1 Tax=Roseimarinus sediminis TaxID=1610899 RepID=UPI003D1BE513
MDQKNSTLALGTDNVWKLLLQYAIPSVIAMTAASLYNITDSIFIGQGVGALAISGLAITFPLINLAAAIGSLIGVGAATLMSLRLGQKDYTTANHILGNVFVLNLLMGTVYSILILLFLDPILYFFGASSVTIGYARDYMVIITLGNVITHMYLGLNAMLRAIGKPRFSMYTTLASVVINILLTWLFIFVFDWGIKGSAFATVIAQALMLVWQIKMFSKRDSFIHIQWSAMRLKTRIVKDSLSIGMAPFLMNTAMSAIVIIVNQQLVKYGGDLTVGAYGIINRVVIFFPMIVLGLTQGMQPIAGYNYGARNFERVNRVLKFTIILGTGTVLLGFTIGELFPHTVASIFTSDQQLIDIAVPGLRIVMMFFPIIGFQMVTSSFFQSIGMPRKAIFMSLSRQVLFLLPALLFLPLFFGVKGVWYSMPVSDLLSAIISAVMLYRYYQQTKNKQ